METSQLNTCRYHLNALSESIISIYEVYRPISDLSTTRHNLEKKQPISNIRKYRFSRASTSMHVFFYSIKTVLYIFLRSRGKHIMDCNRDSVRIVFECKYTVSG